MPLIIHYRNLDHDPAIEPYVEGELERLSRFLLKPGRGGDADAQTEVNLLGQRGRVHATVVIQAKGGSTTAKHEGRTPMEAVSGALQKMGAQLRKRKERVQDHRRVKG